MRYFVVVVAALLLLPTTASADTYMSTLGFDTNSCDEAAPCKTLQRSLTATPAGGTLRVLPGLHGTQTAQNVAPTAPVTVRVLDGAKFSAINLRGVHDVVFDGDLQRGRVGTFDMQRGTGGWVQRITVKDLDLGTVRMLNNTTDVLVDGNYFHDSGTGISGPGRVDGTYTSRRIRITGNTFERFSADAMQASDWSDVIVDHNVFRDIRDPRAATGECWNQPNPVAGLPECTHSDGIQTAGGATNWLIDANLIFDTATQGIIMQGNTPAVPRPTSNITIRRNAVVRESGGPTNATQLNGVTGLLVEQNILCGRLNGIAISGAFGVTPTDAIIHDNITSKIALSSGAVAAENTGNRVVTC